jgi:hypothetical protein
MHSENINILVGKLERDKAFGTQRNRLWVQRGGYCHKDS